jgi:hypothetical protein
LFVTSESADDTALSRNNKTVLITVKCVATSYGEAVQGAQIIHDRLDDSGEWDISSALAVDPDWHLLTVSEVRGVSLMEMDDDGATQIYHEGYTYSIFMEEK